MLLCEVPEGKVVRLLRTGECIKVLKQNRNHVEVESAKGWRIEGLNEKVDK